MVIAQSGFQRRIEVKMLFLTAIEFAKDGAS